MPFNFIGVGVINFIPTTFPTPPPPRYITMSDESKQPCGQGSNSGAKYFFLGGALPGIKITFVKSIHSILSVTVKRRAVMDREDLRVNEPKKQVRAGCVAPPKPLFKL